MLTDMHLKEMFAQGKLKEDELNLLLEVDPVERYMYAFTDNQTSTLSHITRPYEAACLLRKLVGKPPPQLYPALG
jgi:hypothetical protein